MFDNKRPSFRSSSLQMTLVTIAITATFASSCGIRVTNLKRAIGDSSGGASVFSVTGEAFSPLAFDEDTSSGTITLPYTDVNGGLATSCAVSNLSNVTVTQACT